MDGVNLYLATQNDWITFVDRLGLQTTAGNPTMTVKEVLKKAGNCGEFDVKYEFTVSNVTVKSYLIQKISIKYNMSDCKGVKFSKPDIFYYERWNIEANSTKPTEGNPAAGGVPAYSDRFNEPNHRKFSENKCSIGKIETTAEAWIVPSSVIDGDAQTVKFWKTADKWLLPAGILLCMPASDTGKMFWENKYPAVHKRTLTAEWNCCKDDGTTFDNPTTLK